MPKLPSISHQFGSGNRKFGKAITSKGKKNRERAKLQRQFEKEKLRREQAAQLLILSKVDHNLSRKRLLEIRQNEYLFDSARDAENKIQLENLKKTKENTNGNQ